MLLRTSYALLISIGLVFNTACCSCLKRSSSASAALSPAYSAASAAEIAKLHEANGGATYNPSRGGDQSGKPAYAVSVFKSRERVFPSKKIDPLALTDYAEANRDLLSQEKFSMGTWFDESSNQTYLDVVITVPKANGLGSALECARRARQLAIFDLEKLQTIAVPKTTTTVGTQIEGCEP